ncbi:MAG: adenosine deaminase, partial [Lachnospiraceae bacterium]|nr:adenosine deaminase [Lachnospiraceae bacterium]
TQKSQAFAKALSGRTVRQYYTDEFQKEFDDIRDVKFEINKRPSYPVFKENVKELPWDKYPVIIAGGSFTSGSKYPKLSENDKHVLQALLDHLDPQKVFFVVGHKLAGHEKYIVEHNPGFDIYAIIPSLMDQKQMKKLQRANLKGIRISTESQEMGIYKSFNYEIFERRNCVLFAFDGNSSIANLVQEARNGKGRAWVFTYPKSAMLKAKAKSLEGYVTNNATVDVVVEKIREFEDNIGTKMFM